MPDQDNPVLMKMHSKIFGHFDAVSCHLRQGHGRRNRFAGCAKSASGATLVPLNDGEIFFPRLPARRHRNGRTTRATVNKEDNRIVAIFAANLNPLVDAADFYVHSFLDAVWRLNREGARAEMLAISAKSKSQAYCENRHGENSFSEQDFDDKCRRAAGRMRGLDNRAEPCIGSMHGYVRSWRIASLRCDATIGLLSGTSWTRAISPIGAFMSSRPRAVSV